MANQKASKWRPPAIGLIGLSQKPPVLRNVINLRDKIICFISFNIEKL